ncbi:hypothetical protein B9D88_005975, partial [Burkholderia pseudomallei]
MPALPRFRPARLAPHARRRANRRPRARPGRRRAPGRSARFSRTSPFAILGFSTGRAPPASFIQFHAPSL